MPFTLIILCLLAGQASSRRALSLHEPVPLDDGPRDAASALLETEAALRRHEQEFPVNRAVAPFLHLHGLSGTGSPLSRRARDDASQHVSLEAASPRRVPKAADVGGWPLRSSAEPMEERDDVRSPQELSLMPVKVEVLKGQYGNMLVPADWARNFAPGGLRYLAMGTAGEVFVASNLRDASSKLVVKIRDNSLMWVKREFQIIDRLTHYAREPLHNILSYYESRVVGDRAFILMEGANNTLEQLLEWQAPGRDGKTKTLPLHMSLQILIDLLHGVRSLDHVGVAHYDLTEQSVLMSNSRALIAGFGGARLAEDVAMFGCDSLTDTHGGFVGSALRQAPELGDGPTFIGSASNVWSVGMIFARLVLGYIPTASVVLAREKYGRWLHDGGEKRLQELDSDAYGREQIRLIVRKFFDIELDEGWYHLEEEVRELMAGLLERDPRSRWSAAGALAFVERLCEERGIQVAPPQPSKTAPSNWFSAWQ